MTGVPPIPCRPEWPSVHLRDITTKIGSGATPTGGSSSYLPSRENFALIRSQNVFDRRFDPAGLAFITDDQAEGLRGATVQPDDILLNITGDGITFGRACAVPADVLPACVNQHVSIIRVNRELADPGYVLSFLTHPVVKPYIEGFNAGGSRRAVTKGHIESFVLPLPPVEEQHAIAAVLGALDGKIELNRRTNETLEAMARALFRDWFVEFGPTRAKMEGRPPYLAPDLWSLFPDRLNADGKPEGWTESRVEDILELRYGKALRSEDRVPGTVPVYGSGGITGTHKEALVRGPTIIVGRKGTVGSLYWEDNDCFPIDTVFFVEPKIPLTFCYYHLQTLGLTDMNTDAAVPGLNRANVLRLPVPWGGPDLPASFNKEAKLIRARIRANSEESDTLATLRDLLLPKLVTGEIRVKDAEGMVGEVI